MEFMKPDVLQTVAGAVVVVSIVTAVLKAIIPAISGRVTQLVVLGLALVIVGVTMPWQSAVGVLMNVINALVIFTSAMGLDQAVNLAKRQGG